MHYLESIKAPVVVVGGGPAGSSCAWALASRGRSCILLDKEVFPRQKVCGGVISSRAAFHLVDSGMVTERELDDISLAEHLSISFWNREEHLRTYVSDSHPVRIVDRETFDSFLLERASNAGTDVITGSRVESVSAVSVTVTSGREFSYSSLVGADGSSSTVRKYVSGRRSRKTGMGLEYSVPALEAGDNFKGLEIHFGYIPYGYIWVIPDREKVSIGAGAVGSPAKPSDIVEALGSFMEHMGIETGDLQLLGASIPSLLLDTGLGRDNLYLAGDAAGLVDQVSGEGIGHAIESGFLVAECIISGGRREKILDRDDNCIDMVRQSGRYRHLLYSRLTRSNAMMSLRDNSTYAAGYWKIISGEESYSRMFRKILE